MDEVVSEVLAQRELPLEHGKVATAVSPALAMSQHPSYRLSMVKLQPVYLMSTLPVPKQVTA